MLDPNGVVVVDDDVVVDDVVDVGGGDEVVVCIVDVDDDDDPIHVTATVALLQALVAMSQCMPLGHFFSEHRPCLSQKTYLEGSLSGNLMRPSRAFRWRAGITVLAVEA